MTIKAEMFIATLVMMTTEMMMNVMMRIKIMTAIVMIMTMMVAWSECVCGLEVIQAEGHRRACLQ